MTISNSLFFFLLNPRWLINQIDPTSKNKKKAKEKAELLLKRYCTINCNLDMVSQK
jgi:hypothetical protein